MDMPTSELNTSIDAALLLHTHAASRLPPHIAALPVSGTQPPTRLWFKRQPPLCPTLLFVSLLGRRLKRLAWEAFGGNPASPPPLRFIA